MKRLLTGFILIFVIGNAFAQDDPTSLTADATSSTAINLSWAQVVGAPPADGYVIYAIESSGAFPAASASPTDDTNMADGSGVIKIVGNGTTSYNLFSGFLPGTSYTFRIYTYRAAALSGNFVEAIEFTHSAQPGSHSGTFTAIKNAGDGNRIDLTFLAAATLTDAEGYVIYRKQGSAADISGLADGSAAPASLDGGNTILVTTTNDTDLTFADDGLAGGQTFHYVLVPYNWNGADVTTYNFRAGGPPVASATTDVNISVVELQGAGTNISASPLGSGGANRAILGFSITTDGPVTLDDLNIPVTADPTGIFLNPRIFQSANTAYSFVGDSNEGSGTVESDHLEFLNIGYALPAGTTHFFIVVNVSPSVNSSTTAVQPSLSEADITFSAGSAAAFSFSGIDYSFIDNTDPNHVAPFDPADNATQVSLTLSQVVITFSEGIVNDGSGLDLDNNIRIRNVTDVTTHETIDPSVPGKVTIGGPGNTQATIALSVPFEAGKSYAVLIGNSVFEDLAGNNYSGISTSTTWNFTAETAPSITNFRNATNAGTVTSACGNDVVTINGNNFGAALKPAVTINGVFIVDPADILTFTNTAITFTLSPAAPNGTITVTNNTSGLTSAASGSSLTVLPAITTPITYTLNPASPAQGNDVDVELNAATIQSNITYRLILDSYTDTGGVIDNTDDEKDDDTNDFASVILSTTALTDPGSYSYFVTGERTECTTRMVVPVISIVISELTAVPTATKTDICAGETTTLHASSTGGPGFNSYQWYDGATLIGTGTSLDVSPIADKTYTLRVTSTAPGPNNFDEEDILITVASNPTAEFLGGIKTKFSDQDSVYRLSDSVSVAPVGGTIAMSGLGVSQYSNGKFYFDPKTVGPQTDLPIFLSYKVGNCYAYDTLKVNVSTANAILGLDNFYCTNIVTPDALSPNDNYLQPYSYQYWDGAGYTTVEYTYTYKRLGFYTCDTGTVEDATTDPLTQVGSTDDYTLDIPTIVSRNYTNNCFYIMIVCDMAYKSTSSGGVVTEYLYEDQWAGYQYFELSYIRQVPTITSIKEGEFICKTSDPILLVTDQPTYTTVNWAVNAAGAGSVSDDLFTPNAVSFSSDAPKNLTITYNYKDDNTFPAGGCSNSVQRSFNVVPQLGAPAANDEVYCEDYDGRTILRASTWRTDLPKISLAWYDGTSFEQLGEGETFDTKVSTDVASTKDFLLRQLYFGCESLPDEATLTITEAPDADITFGTQCEDREGTFVAEFGPNTTWAWNMGDEASSTYTSNVVNHTYPNTGVFTITVKITTEDASGKECTANVVETVVVNQNPTPTFTYEHVCEGDFTRFTGGTKDFAITHFEWDFGDGDLLAKNPAATNVSAPNNNGGRTAGTYQAPRHNFQMPAEYEVTMVGYTSQGCYDTLKRKITILEYLDPFTSADPYAMTDLDGGKGFWTIEDVNDSSTWEFAVPSKTVINNTEMSWVTNASGSYKPQDVSFLNSPCLNIAGIDKPVLSMDYIVNTPPNTDGAVLEYSVDNGESWKSVGSPGEGDNWFNTTGFFLGNIGSSPVGWSGRGMTEFQSGKHALDNIVDFMDLQNREKVRFRIAFASDPSTENDGFAFNNFTITKRNRTLLVETFTNEGDEDYADNNANFALISPLETTKIQYHVSFPSDDSNSAVNKTDPSARAAYYGVVMSDVVIPRGYVDGVSGGNFANPLWAAKEKDKQSLISSPFNIQIGTDLASGQLHITATVTMLEEFIGRPILHMAVVQKTDGENQFVLRKMLPNAAGTRMEFNGNWPVLLPAGTVLQFDEFYSPHHDLIDEEDLAVVVFIQGEVDKRVHQSEINIDPGIPDNVTGIEQPEFADRITVYPNPADKEFVVQLPAKAMEEIALKLIDPFGRALPTKGFARGDQSRSISTKDLSGGMYILQLESAQGLVRKKVMVLHD
jgi:hypothetical protein